MSVLIDVNRRAAAVVCQGLTKDYGQGHGVFDLDLSIARGRCSASSVRTVRARPRPSGC